MFPAAAAHVLTRKPAPEERDVIARIRAGDAEAFSAVFHAHYTALCSFVASYVDDAEVAEELVQELFCALWERRAEWNPPGRIRHYLLAAARNRSISYLRHLRVALRTSRRWAGTDDESPGMGHRTSSPDRDLEIAELTRACRQAIHTLPERRRLVIIFRWQHQMTHAEIAHALGISVKGVESLLTRALKSLRTYLSHFEP
jgi:RNA polymerase sigma-70 factor, ECF subfamily